MIWVVFILISLRLVESQCVREDAPDGKYIVEKPYHSNGNCDPQNCPAGHYCKTYSTPIPCPVGTYRSTTGANDLSGCDSCTDYLPDKYYTVSVGSTACKKCPMGFSCTPTTKTKCTSGEYTISEGHQDGCKPCPANKYCPDVTLDPIDCPAGTANSNTGQTACGVCTAGQYQTATGQATCSGCTPGSMCPSPERAPIACPRGTIPSGTPTTCQACATGTYTPGTGSIGCTNCPAGHYCPNPYTDPIPCPHGTKGTGIAVRSKCTNCNSGEYTQLTGQTTCNSCPAGSRCPSIYDQPIPCPAGTTSSGSSTTCSLCSSGKECSDPTSPTNCGAGTYSPASLPASACIACPDGYYQNSAGPNTACIACPVGNDCTSKTAASPCAAGSYSPHRHSGCLPCAEGFYSTIASAECLECPAGKECATAASSGVACGPGKYSPGRVTACLSCPSGTIPNSGTPDRCVACDKGKWCDGTTATGCADGTYAAERGKSACDPCPDGYQCSNKDQAPAVCVVGQVPRSDKMGCEACPAGKTCFGNGTQVGCADGYTRLTGKMYCEKCPAGFSCDATSQTACVGTTYSPLGEKTCLSCPSGHSCSDKAFEPVECGLGFFSTGAAACTVCPAGEICNTTGMSAGIPCVAGTYSLPGSVVCTDCEAGFECAATTAAPGAGGACLAGTYSLGSATSCTDCPVGYECGSPRAAPILCKNGTYSLGKQLHCYPCPRGSYCYGIAKVDCDVGTYSVEGMDTCFDCPPGYYCPSPSRDPIMCARGSYSAGGVVSACTACDAGYYCPPGVETGTAFPCPVGHYCPLSAFVPIACRPGKIGDGGTGKSTEGAACSDCPAGYFCPYGTIELEEANICPPGYYCPAGSTTLGIACGVGTYNPLPKTSAPAACLACPAGFTCPQGTTNYTLNRCPAGQHCDGSTATNCIGGTFSAREGLTAQSECDECPAGHECAAGSTNPLPCSPGTYNNAAGGGTGTCIICPPGNTCPYVGTVTPEPCEPGHFCLAGRINVGLVDECRAGTFTNENNLQVEADCETCWEGYACLKGTGGKRRQPIPCSRGYYCPGAPQPGETERIYTFGVDGAGTVAPNTNCCPTGSFNNRTGLRKQADCTPCTPGYYCETTCLTAPTGICDAGRWCGLSSTAATQNDCPAGTYSDRKGLTAAHECNPCPPGEYCVAASTQPTKCPTGTYYDRYGAVDVGPSYNGDIGLCIICPGGYKCGVGQVNPLECGQGYYSDDRSSTCSVCLPGHYCPDNTTSLVNMTTRFVCAAGTYCAPGMLKEPEKYHTECPIGSFCPEGTPDPVECPGGTYGGRPGLSAENECEACPRGFYCTNGSAQVTGPCAPGYYCPVNSSSPTQIACPDATFRTRHGGYAEESCSICPGGFYCPNATAVPIDCPRGYFCAIGSVTYEECPIGTFGNSTNIKGMEFCTVCPAGYYCEGKGETKPTGMCDPGFFCSGGSFTSAPPGPPTGGKCPRGGYCVIGSTYPTSCAAGTYNNYTGGKSQDDCKACPGGFYCSGSNNPYPSDQCWAGFFCDGGSATPIQHQCPQGSYCEIGSSAPTACAAGTYNKEFNQSVCLNCPMGYYCPNTGMIDYITYPCPRGKYCPEGTFDPPLCPAKKFSNRTMLQNETQCRLCLPGQYCETPGLTKPTDYCDAGFYCLEGSNEADPSGKSYGDTCKAGHYCPKGNYLNIPCPIGTYRSTTGGQSVADCAQCDAGSYCEKTALSAVSGNCTEGYYCSGGSYSIAPIDGVVGNKCPPGTFCPFNSSAPTPCPEGTYNKKSTQPSCKDCPAGYFCNISTVTPYICPAGKYCPAKTDSTIPLCPAGSFSNVVGLESMDQCTLCSGGRACTTPGLIEPDGFCKGGIFCKNGSIDVDGNTGVLLGYSAICPKGNYCPQGTETPKDCPAGTFSNSDGNVGHSDCELCTGGKYCEKSGLEAPTGDCEEGYYCRLGAKVPRPTDNNATGDYCPKGHYCKPAAESPTPCPEGKFAPEDGQFACDICPIGYSCPLATYEPVKCANGKYCPLGTGTTLQECPIGSFGNKTRLSMETECQLCPAGMICTGASLQKPDGFCPQGSYCLQGASGAATVGVLGGESKTCDTGHYCPTGTAKPIPCPVGTYLGLTGQTSSDACIPCDGGKYCKYSGIDTPTGSCDQGFYCSEGAKVKTPNDGNVTGDICPKGHFCIAGSKGPEECPDGNYANEVGLSSCFACPEGYYCPPKTIEPIICPTGKYCPPSTGVTIPTCPAGSFNGIEGLRVQSECRLCTEGKVCLTPGLTSPDGTCGAGYYCLSGATLTDGTTGVLSGVGGECSMGSFCPAGTGKPIGCPLGTFGNGVGFEGANDCLNCTAGKYCESIGLTEPSGNCSAGFYCPMGQHSSKAIPCPRGKYCPVGSPAPLSCLDGNFANTIGSSVCKTCPIGFFCINSCEDPEVCPVGKYCTDGIARFCPDGTYSLKPQLEVVGECTDCPPGKYCTNGAIVDDCDAGYICYFGNKVPNPNGNGRKGDLCPIGHYCPKGTPTAVACPNSVSGSKGGKNVSSCHACRAGYYCITGSVIEYPCLMGHYCDQNATGLGNAPIKCPNATYRPSPRGESLADCLPCKAGYYCPDEGMAYCERRPAPPGHYTIAGRDAPIPCPAGTFRNITQGDSVGSCFSCTPGYYCPEKSVHPIECGEGTVCPGGSPTELPCPAGYYCLKRTFTPIDCPMSYYCPISSSFPQLCKGHVYCPVRTPYPINCPDGHTGNPSTVYKSSLESSCLRCAPGMFSSVSVGLVCSKCSPGYVCLAGATSATPTNITGQRGYVCPKGYYCPNGTGDPFPCESGNYAPEAKMAECKKCPRNSFQYLSGKSYCAPCGRSSTSVSGSSSCSCVGKNRVYQVSDGSCICKEGFVYFDGDKTASSEDSTYPCSEITFARCGKGKVRSIGGTCVDPKKYCETSCTHGGTLNEDIGICVCEKEAVVEDTLCDLQCRKRQLVTRLVPDEQKIEVYDPVSKRILAEFDVGRISSGNTFCKAKTKCNLNIVSTSKGRGFTGLYDLSTQYLFDMFNYSVHSTVEIDYDRKEALEYLSGKRRSISSNQQVAAEKVGVSNPLVCLEKGKGLIWDLRNNEDGYPVYLRDTLININLNDQEGKEFDYGHFRNLERYVQSATMDVDTFSYTFTIPGIYVFGMSNNPSKVMIVKVMDEDEVCENNAAFRSLTGQNLVLLGVEKKTDDAIFLAPDWVLVIVLLVGVFAMILVCIAAIHYFRTSTLVFSMANARPKLPARLQKEVEMYLVRNTEKEKGIVDLDNFDVRMFHEKMQKLREKMEGSWDGYKRELMRRYRMILDETNMIKDMILKRPDSGSNMVVLVNVRQHVDTLQRFVSDLENNEDYYDEDAMKGIFDEIDNQMKDLENETKEDKKMSDQQLQSVLDTKDMKRYQNYNGMEDGLRDKILDQYRRIRNRLDELRDKLRKGKEENKPKIVRSELLTTFSQVIENTQRDLGKKLNAVNALRMKMNQLTSQQQFSTMNLSGVIASLLNKFLVDALEEIFKKYNLFKEGEDDFEWLKDDDFNKGDDGDYYGDDEEFNKEAKKMKNILRIQQTREIHSFNDEMKEELELEKKKVLETFENIKDEQIMSMKSKIDEKMNDDSVNDEEKSKLLDKMKSEMDWFNNVMENEKDGQLKMIEKLLKEKMEKKRQNLLKIHKSEKKVLQKQLRDEKDYNDQLRISEMIDDDDGDDSDDDSDYSDDDDDIGSDGTGKKKKKKEREEKLLQRKKLIEEQINKRKKQKEEEKKEKEDVVDEIVDENKTLDKETSQKIHNNMNERIMGCLNLRKQELENNSYGFSDEEKSSLLADHSEDEKNLDNYMNDAFNQQKHDLDDRIKQRMERMRKREEEKERFEKERELLVQEKDIGKLKGLMKTLNKEEVSKDEEIQQVNDNLKEEEKKFEEEKKKDKVKLEKEFNNYVENKQTEVIEETRRLEQEKNEEINKLRKKVDDRLKVLEEKKSGEELESERKKLIGRFNTEMNEFEESYNLQKQKQEEKISLLVEDRKRKLMEKMKLKQEKKEMELLRKKEEELNKVVTEKEEEKNLRIPKKHRKGSSGFGLDRKQSSLFLKKKKEEIVVLKEDDKLEIRELEEQHKDDIEKIKEELEMKQKKDIEDYNAKLQEELKKSKQRFEKIKSQKVSQIKRTYEEKMSTKKFSSEEKNEIFSNYRKDLVQLTQKMKGEMSDHKRSLQDRIKNKKKSMLERNLNVLKELESRQKKEEEMVLQKKQLDEEKKLLIAALKTKKYHKVDEGLGIVVIPRQQREIDKLNDFYEKRKTLISKKSAGADVERKKEAAARMKELTKELLKKRVNMKQRHLEEQMSLRKELVKFEEVIRKDNDLKEKIENELSSFTKSLEEERRKNLDRIKEEREKEKEEIRARLQEIEAKKEKRMKQLRSSLFAEEEEEEREKLIENFLKSDEEKKKEADDGTKQTLVKKVSAQEEQQRLLEVQEENLQNMKTALREEYNRQAALLQDRITEYKVEHLKKKEEEKEIANRQLFVGMQKADWSEFGKYFGLQRAKNKFLKNLFGMIKNTTGGRKKLDAKGSDDYVKQIFSNISGIEFVLSGNNIRPEFVVEENVSSSEVTVEDRHPPEELLPLYQFGRKVVQICAEKFHFVSFNLLLAKEVKSTTAHRRNAFRNLFDYRRSKKTLLIKESLLKNRPGRFLLLLIHCSAHIMSREILFDDFGQKFQKNFYRMLFFVYEYFLEKIYIDEA